MACTFVKRWFYEQHLHQRFLDAQPPMFEVDTVDLLLWLVEEATMFIFMHMVAIVVWTTCSGSEMSTPPPEVGQSNRFPLCPNILPGEPKTQGDAECDQTSLGSCPKEAIASACGTSGY